IGMDKPRILSLLPYGLKSMIECFTRAAILSQPEDIPKFLAEYTAQLVNSRGSNFEADIKEVSFLNEEQWGKFVITIYRTIIEPVMIKYLLKGRSKAVSAPQSNKTGKPSAVPVHPTATVARKPSLPPVPRNTTTSVPRPKSTAKLQGAEQQCQARPTNAKNLGQKGTQTQPTKAKASGTERTRTQPTAPKVREHKSKSPQCVTPNAQGHEATKKQTTKPKTPEAESTRTRPTSLKAVRPVGATKPNQERTRIQPAKLTSSTTQAKKPSSSGPQKTKKKTTASKAITPETPKTLTAEPKVSGPGSTQEKATTSTAKIQGPNTKPWVSVNKVLEKPRVLWTDRARARPFVDQTGGTFSKQSCVMDVKHHQGLSQIGYSRYTCPHSGQTVDIFRFKN
uniref:RIIa domain-containing protein n=1 Tax=Echeneis naucrates TaxID=173247 RepID=A0A665WRA2_ECHNA